MNNKAKYGPIGDIVVFLGRPENDNPYKKDWDEKVGGYVSRGLQGTERIDALQAFRDGNKEKTSKYTFWYAPSHGGAKEMLSSEEIDWRTSGLYRYYSDTKKPSATS